MTRADPLRELFRQIAAFGVHNRVSPLRGQSRVKRAFRELKNAQELWGMVARVRGERVCLLNSAYGGS